MLKIALLLSLMGFDLVFARRDLGRCGSFGCSSNDNISKKHEHKKHHKRHYPFKCDSSSSSSDSSSSSSSSSDSGHHRVKKLDCDFGEFTDIDSSDCIVRRRKHRRRRCDSSSSSGYSSCSSSSSSSSCSSSSSSSSSGVTPIPGNRCTALFETALKVLDGALLTYLKNFELQYKQQIISFLTNAIAGVNAFNPQFTASDYTAIVAAINAALPAGATPLPASVATELLNIQTATIASIVKAIQNTINGVLGDLLARVQSLCFNELIDFINNGLLTSQLTSAFALAINEIATAVNTMITAQLALLQQYNLPAAALAVATTQLTNNGTALTTFLTSQLNVLQGQIATLLANLLTSLSTLITNGVKGFQNLAISQINALVTRIFGTIGVPIPIPPVALLKPNPTDPENPTDPTDPKVPENPTDPKVPENPTDPKVPENPTDDAEKDKSS